MRCKRRLLTGAEGATAVVVALLMAVLLGVGALAIDLGQIFTERHFLQNTADAAALASINNLFAEQNIVNPPPTSPPYYHTGPHYVTITPNAAYNAATGMIQTAATNKYNPNNSPSWTYDPNGYKINVVYGYFNDKSPLSTTNPSWYDSSTVQTTDTTTSQNVNAVQVTITRSGDKTGSSYTHSYGPVTNLFAGIFGMSTTVTAATSAAYMGYIHTTYPGTVELPVALPEAGPISPLVSRAKSGWLDKFGPDQAMAATPKTIVFRDSGGYYMPGSSVPQNIQQYNPSVTGGMSFAHGDATQIYFFTVGSGDAVPNTMQNILTGIYGNPQYGSSYPSHVDKLTLGQRIYPQSEYCWGTGYIGPLFQALQKAYYYKTTGHTNTAPPAGTPWRVTMPVYGIAPNPLQTSQLRKGFRYLAQLLAPWPTEAFACATITAPVIYINGFVNADIVGVTYTANSNDGKNYRSWPQTINHIRYNNILDFLTRYSNSVWNANSMTITNVTDANTIIPGAQADSSSKSLAGLGGGLSSKQMNNAATPNVGALANIPRLIH